MLTFALFVGMALLVMGMAVILIARKGAQTLVHRSLLERAQLTVTLFDSARTEGERGEIVTNINRLAPFDAYVVTGDRAYGEESARVAPLLERPYRWDAVSEGIRVTRFSESMIMPGDAHRHYLILERASPRLTVLVNQSVRQVHTLIQRVELALLAGMGFVLFLSLLGAWISARNVVKPLDAVRNSARRISEGHFEERIRVHSRASEFQDLARRLNQMAGSLREKIKELERLTQLQNEFIGNVSHEVRNPIFAVGGYLEALSTANLKEDQRRRYAEKGLSNLQRLNNLFNDLIEIARLEYREDLIQTRQFDLMELLDEIADMLRPKAEEKGLRLETDNSPIFVTADRNRLRQVLVNLIDNAIAYTDEGTVRCRFRRRLDKVRIEIIDTGRGIPEEHLERVFERFYRVDPDRSRKSGGTGLGLSIVKQILHAHGETVHVESTVGRGTRFWFELPYAEEPVESEEFA